MRSEPGEQREGAESRLHILRLSQAAEADYAPKCMLCYFEHCNNSRARTHTHVTHNRALINNCEIFVKIPRCDTVVSEASKTNTLTHTQRRTRTTIKYRAPDTARCVLSPLSLVPCQPLPSSSVRPTRPLAMVSFKALTASKLIINWIFCELVLFL